MEETKGVVGCDEKKQWRWVYGGIERRRRMLFERRSKGGEISYRKRNRERLRERDMGFELNEEEEKR